MFKEVIVPARATPDSKYSIYAVRQWMPHQTRSIGLCRSNHECCCETFILHRLFSKDNELLKFVFSHALRLRVANNIHKPH